MTRLQSVLVTPLTGPLARFGIAGAEALHLWATRTPGVAAPWTGVDLEVIDAHPSAGAAMRTAAARKPDIIFGPYGSGPAVAAATATDRMIWNHGGATGRLRRPEFTHVSNVMAPAERYFAGVLRAVRAVQPECRLVSLLHPNTGFGNEVAAGSARSSRELDLDLTTVRYARGQVAAAAYTLPAGDILLVAGAFEDELTAARILLDRPWRAVAFVGAGVQEVLAPLGRKREGLLGPAQWVARVAQPPEEGPDARWFVSAFRRATNTDPPYPAAAAFAAGVLAARCIRDAGSTNDASVLNAAAGLVVRTLFGDFRVDPATGVQVGHEILVVQWHAGIRRVVWPPTRAEAHIRPLPRELHLGGA